MSEGPAVALKYDDGTYEVPILASGVADLTGVLAAYNSSSSPNEKGMKFQVPVPFVCDGAWFRASPQIGQPYIDAILYDSGGSVVRSVSFGSQGIIAQGQEDGFWAQWEPYTMTPNSDYTLSLKPTSTTNINWEYRRFASAAIKNAMLGSTWYYRTRTGSGSWTDYDVYWAESGIRIVGVDYGD